ncbi:MAG: PP2C family serine/threonine-protein phosphatase [Halioglobus sp.]
MNNDSIQFAGRTHPGHKRSHNEDCFEADAALGLFLVADGVGGHSCGEIASDIVRQTIKQEVVAGSNLHAAVQASHRAVLARIAEDESTQGMGSTAVVLQLVGTHYNICWVGDSRAYQWDQQLKQLTADHNRASELLANNLITPAQAAVHPERHVLTQSLGVSESIVTNPGEVQGELASGQSILLCSDGLTDDVDEIIIARIMGGSSSPEEKAEALLKAALDAGGSDNITALVVGMPADPSEQAGDLDTTRDTGHAAENGAPSTAKFPVRALIAVSIVTAIALWLLL